MKGSPQASPRARRGRWVLAFLIATALAILSPALAETQTPAETQQAAADAARRLDLQTELPRDLEVEPPSGHFTLPAELFWLVLIGGVALILYSLRDEIPLWRWSARRGWTEGDAGAAALESTAPEAVAAAADDLARQGRFSEAMHALLLQGLADVRKRLDEQFADSLTSREILRSTRLPERGREPLREIIARVERTYFGEYSAGPQDYAACRARFDDLERVLQGAAGA